MNNQHILEKVRDVFPELEIKESDIETQRHRIMRDFYYAFVKEFHVDCDHITRVQLCQSISGDDDMIPTINLMCCLNALIPAPSVGLFDLISPSQNFMWKKMDLCLRYFDFSDNVLSALYDMCNPFIESKKAIKQYKDAIVDLNDSTNDTLVRIRNENGMIEEAEAAARIAEDETKEHIDERRALDHKIQEVFAKKEMLLRKKHQGAAALNDLKRKMDLHRKNKLDRSFDCGDQIIKLKENLQQIQQKRTSNNALIDEERKSHQDMTGLNAILASRCASAQEILKELTKLKGLEEQKKEKEAAKLDVSVVEGLDHITDEITKTQEENEQLIKLNAREIYQLQKSIERKKEFEDNKCKLEKLKSEVGDVQAIINIIKVYDDKEIKMRESFRNEESRLKLMEAELVERARRKYQFFRAEADNILEATVGIHNLQSKKK